MEIRHRTENWRGLEHALRAIVEAGGTLANLWDVQHVIAVGDAAAGAPVLRRLYDRMSGAPAPVDLDAFWKQLGVERRADGVHLDEEAGPRARVPRHRW